VPGLQRSWSITREIEMTTLRIEHPIHEFAIWKAAFDRFEQARTNAGVRSHAIRLADDDPNYLFLDLEFDNSDQAAAFAAFLRQNVWSTPAASPGLAGDPQTRILNLQI
jgi:hypothetical protein